MNPKTHLTVLHGPYAIDYTDFPSSGGVVNLFTPTVGDVLLRVFPDFQASTDFGSFTGSISIKQGIYRLAASQTGNRNQPNTGRLDNIPDSVDFNGTTFAANGQNTSYLPNPVYTSGFVFHSADSVQIEWEPVSDGSALSSGHIELYFLVAHPI